jgi:hypothetical protein
MGKQFSQAPASAPGSDPLPGACLDLFRRSGTPNWTPVTELARGRRARRMREADERTRCLVTVGVGCQP